MSSAEIVSVRLTTLYRERLPLDPWDTEPRPRYPVGMEYELAYADGVAVLGRVASSEEIVFQERKGYARALVVDREVYPLAEECRFHTEFRRSEAGTA